VNHLWAGDVSGGFIGVDIFFVISGFLITAHLRREVELTGSLKLAQFWARRAKRLLPAAILVLVASAMITAWILPVTSAQAAYAEIGSAGAYALNWWLAADSLDYFAFSALSPVTHYWSLSVEEQFYIVWPLLILVGLLFSRSRGARVRYWIMVGTLGLVFVGSLAWAVWSVSAMPNAAYFQTPGRAWEFAAGGSSRSCL
jgi:peptidoglycan/LPS O-acetylase OafA/YrhL